MSSQRTKHQAPRAASGAADSAQALVEQLAAAETAATRGARAAALTPLWTWVLAAPHSRREELLKLLPPPRLLVLMEGADDCEAAHAAAGCLACLVQHPTWLAQLTTTAVAANRLVAACMGLLSGPHDRSRLPAMQLLQALSRCPVHVPRLAPALPQLIALLAASGGPGWAGGRDLAAAAAVVLAALLAPSECEAVQQQQERRLSCLAAGCEASLLQLLHSGCVAAQLPAAACLRFLALAPGAAAAMTAPGVVRQLLALLAPGTGLHPAVASYVSGIALELATSQTAAEALLAAGAVPVLLATVAASAHAGGSKPAKKKPKATKAQQAASARAGSGYKGSRPSSAPAGSSGSSGSKGSSRPAAAEQPVPASVLLQDPVAAAGVALCNAIGALHHLTFTDSAKQQVAAAPQLGLLVQLLRTQGATDGAHDHLVGLLWNVALLDSNQPLLAAAGAPAHLVRPVPARWTATSNRQPC